MAEFRTVTRRGSSVGFNVPREMLRVLGLSVGDRVVVVVVNGQIVAYPVTEAMLDRARKDRLEAVRTAARAR